MKSIKEVPMIFAFLSIPIVIAAVALFCLPGFSEGKQLITGDALYSNQGPKLK